MLKTDYKHPSLTRLIFLIAVTVGVYLYYYLRNISQALEIPEKFAIKLKAALLSLKFSLYYFIFDLHYQLYTKMTGNSSAIFEILSSLYPWLILISFFAALFLILISINSGLLQNKLQLCSAATFHIFYLDYQIAKLQAKPRKLLSYLMPLLFVILLVVAERRVSAHLNRQLKTLETQLQEFQNLKNQLEGLY